MHRLVHDHEGKLYVMDISTVRSIWLLWKLCTSLLCSVKLKVRTCIAAPSSTGKWLRSMISILQLDACVVSNFRISTSNSVFISIRLNGRSSLRHDLEHGLDTSRTQNIRVESLKVCRNQLPTELCLLTQACSQFKANSIQITSQIELGSHHTTNTVCVKVLLYATRYAYRHQDTTTNIDLRDS